MNFTKQSCIAFRNEINAAVAAIAAKHNVSISAGAAKFTNATIEFKLNIAVIGESGKAITKESLALPIAIAQHNLSVGASDKTFTVNGLSLKLSGYNNRCYARPWLATDVRTNKVYKLATHQVEQAIGTKPSSFILRQVAAPTK